MPDWSWRYFLKSSLFDCSRGVIGCRVDTKLLTAVVLFTIILNRSRVVATVAQPLDICTFDDLFGHREGDRGALHVKKQLACSAALDELVVGQGFITSGA